MSKQPGSIVAILLFMATAPVFAQPISFNGSLQDGDETLENGEYVDEYEIEVRQGELVELKMLSDSIDTYLVVILPDGEQVENDDADEDLNAGLYFIAAQTGTYRILATSAMEEETGRYTLTGSRRAVRPHEKTKGELNAQDTRNWKTGEYCDLYEIELAPNETRAIELSSDAFDTYLVAHGADGQMLSNDDSTDTSNSMLVLEGGPRGMTFTLVVTTFSTDETGPYRMTSWQVAE
ncbi:MAG: hypothetical protein AAGC44_08380 [Planctomycetota bacterium]